MPLLEAWLENRWLTWGLGPILAANLGTWPLGYFLNWYTRQSGVRETLVAWKGGKGNRSDDIKVSNDKIPYLDVQIWGSTGAVMTLCGPTAIFGGVVSAFLLHALCGMDWQPLDWLSFASQVVSMYVIGDFGLYWGHRVQHEVPYLYNRFHSVHHALHAPTAIGALYVDSVDATLQASLPILAAALAVRPHPLAFYGYVAYRVAEHVLNHSGLDGSFIDVLFLKFECLGRAKASHHDSHHRFGARGTGKPMNLGEGFWIWDWAFGTLADRAAMRV
mmetsp:Transcript_20774/g.31455  ORF Transcript_20774/g.31455 Transcript_20774/m.31455 type:complete len:275 (+) Transcript_20774:201-1025(+)